MYLQGKHNGGRCDGRDFEDALETGSRAERLQADPVWVQKPRSSGIHELSSAEWLQLRRGRAGAGQRANVPMDKHSGR